MKTLDEILKRYPKLNNILKDTENEEIKVISANSEYKLYINIKSDKPFHLNEKNSSIACDSLEDISDYINKKYPLIEGQDVVDMPWLGNRINIVAVNENTFLFVDENNKYGAAYSSFCQGRLAKFKGMTLSEIIDNVKNEFEFLKKTFINTNDKIYSLEKTEHNYLILRNLSDNTYTIVLKQGFENHDNRVSWLYSKDFKSLNEAQTASAYLYEIKNSCHREMLNHKIQAEYKMFIENLEKMPIDEIFKRANEVYAVEQIRNVFDCESGVVLPKATTEYLLNENVCALAELSKGIVEETDISFSVENVNTAIEDIQCRLEKDNEKQYEFELFKTRELQ